MSKVFLQSSFAFIAFSILIHIGFVGSVHLMPENSESENTETVEIQYVDPEKLAALKKMQVIEQDKKALNNDVPEDAKFLGRHNQRVVEQTKADRTGEFNNDIGAPNPQQAKQQQPQEKPALDLKDLTPQFQMQPKKNAAQTGKGPAQTDDHLKDVESGLQTLLSSREFVYYTYYSRIRGKIRMHWETKIKEKVVKILRSGRKLASSRDRTTQIVVILDGVGSLLNVQVIGQSGVIDLDDAAVEAFRAAEPFPNPPRGMVESDGKIRIRWDFILEASNSPTKTFDKHS